jgi:hypothetical protein
MSFCETFADLRKRRRIPMRGFEDVEIPSSYINAVEKGDLLPSLPKLERLASVFVQVAGEQKARDPDEDRRLLYEERDRTVFERLGLDSELTEFFVRLKELATEQPRELAGPLQEAAEMLGTLDAAEREKVRDVARRLHDLGDDQRRELADNLYETVLRATAAENGEAGAPAESEREIAGDR